MDKDSTTYSFLSPLPSSEEQEAVASVIIDVQGDCTGLSICIKCPFVDECFNNVYNESAFLDKEIRLRKAENFLFNRLIDDEFKE